MAVGNPVTELSSAGNYVPATRTLSINGVTYDLSANRSWTVGSLSGSGTTNYIPKFTASGTIGNSSLTINTFSGTNEVLNLTSSNASSFELYNGTSTLTLQNFSNDVSLIYQRSAITNSVLYYNGSSASDRYLSLQTEGIDRLIVKQSGNIGIGLNLPDSILQIVSSNANGVIFGSSAGAVGTTQITTTSPGSPISSRLMFGTDGTGWHFRIAKNQAGTITDLFSIQDNGNVGINQTAPTEKLEVVGNVRVSDAFAIGTAPDTNLPFKILKNINSTVGIRFENTSTSSLAFSAIQFGSDVTGGTAFCNFVYASSGITETGVFKPNGTALINTGSGGLNLLSVSQPIRFFTSTGTGTRRAEITNDGDFTHFNGTNPTGSTTDAYRQYSADVVAGNAAPHFRTENGAVVKIYQETTAVGNSIISLGGGNSVLDDTTFDGYTLRQVVKALRNLGILQ